MGCTVAATPRHLLVPTAYQQQHDGSWDEIDTSASGLGLVYSPTTLVTEIDPDGRAISSSTKPDLMVRMLETLDVHDEHRVLEIRKVGSPRPPSPGTPTGRYGYWPA